MTMLSLATVAVNYNLSMNLGHYLQYFHWFQWLSINQPGAIIDNIFIGFSGFQSQSVNQSRAIIDNIFIGSSSSQSQSVNQSRANHLQYFHWLQWQSIPICNQLGQSFTILSY